MRPEETGIGAQPARRASLRVGGEAVDAGDLADELGGRSAPRSRVSASSCGATCCDRVRRALRRGSLIVRVSSRMRRTMSRAILHAEWSARRAPGGEAILVCQLGWCQRAGGDLASSGQRSCSCQRSSLISRVRMSSSRSRWRPAAGSRSSGPARRGGRERSRTPSRSAARAIASASIGSDLPRLRAPRARRPSAAARGARPSRRGRSGTARATRTRAGQSSTTQTRSVSRARAHSSSCPMPVGRAAAVRCSTLHAERR